METRNGKYLRLGVCLAFLLLCVYFYYLYRSAAGDAKQWQSAHARVHGQHSKLTLELNAFQKQHANTQNDLKDARLAHSMALEDKEEIVRKHNEDMKALKDANNVLLVEKETFKSSLEESEDRYKSLQLQCKKSSEQCTADISVSKESYEKLQKRCQEGEAQMTSQIQKLEASVTNTELESESLRQSVQQCNTEVQTLKSHIGQLKVQQTNDHMKQMDTGALKTIPDQVQGHSPQQPVARGVQRAFEEQRLAPPARQFPQAPRQGPENSWAAGRPHVNLPPKADNSFAVHKLPEAEDSFVMNMPEKEGKQDSVQLPAGHVAEPGDGYQEEDEYRSQRGEEGGEDEEGKDSYLEEEKEAEYEDGGQEEDKDLEIEAYAEERRSEGAADDKAQEEEYKEGI